MAAALSLIAVGLGGLALSHSYIGAAVIQTKEAALVLLETFAMRAGITLHWTSVNTSAFEDTGADIDKTTYLQTSTFAHVDYQTTATSVTVDSYNTSYDVYPKFTEIGVYVNGVYNQRIVPASLGASSSIITLPSGGKTVSFVNGLQSRPNPTLNPIGTFVTRLSANARMTRVMHTPKNRLVVYGDSIAVGGNAAIAVAEAWPLLVRAAHTPNSLALEAWGHRSLHEDCADSTARAAFIAKLTTYNPSRIWLAIGTNDFGLNKWSAASFGVAYAALLDDLHTALPATTIFVQTPIVRFNEKANLFGNTLSDYRVQIAAAAVARPAYTILIDGTAIMTNASLVDGVHPSTAGHALYANAVNRFLGI